MWVVDEALQRVADWVKEKDMEIAKHKSEAVMLIGRKKCKSIRYYLEGEEIIPTKSLKYLGIVFDEKMTFGPHIKYVAEKAEKTVNCLRKLMPNTHGAGENKRRLMAMVVNSIILYGAPVWESVLEYKKYKKMIESVQRKIAIKVCRSYRTVSTEALQVLSRLYPLDLLVKERADSYRFPDEHERTRQKLKETWQDRWDNTEGWTQQVIKDINKWTERKHGEIDYHLSQALSGHGVFGSYLKRIKKSDTSECWFCKEEDTPEHTILVCGRWYNERRQAEIRCGRQISKENMMDIMTDNREGWETIAELLRNIMKGKEEEERKRKEKQ